MAPVRDTLDSFTSIFVSDITDPQSFVGVTTSETTNGTLTTPGNGYNYFFYTAPGTFTVNQSGYVDVCVIAGGGGGGSGGVPTAYGGGGGAGGVLERYFVLFTPGPYTITVGGGGAGAPTTGATASQGSPSSIIGPGISLTSIGGGKGGGGPAGGPGGPGGSGGGGGVPGGVRGSGTGINLDRQGTEGGNGVPATRSGGGGGATLNGQWASTNTAANGGTGFAAFGGDPGVPSSYGTANPTPLPGRWFAGGGGGVPGGAGGGPLFGVGGGSSGAPTTGNGSSATVNTGGGGGGGGGSPTGGRSGGTGGSGIVILRTKIRSN